MGCDRFLSVLVSILAATSPGLIDQKARLARFLLKRRVPERLSRFILKSDQTSLHTNWPRLQTTSRCPVPEGGKAYVREGEREKGMDRVGWGLTRTTRRRWSAVGNSCVLGTVVYPLWWLRKIFRHLFSKKKIHNSGRSRWSVAYFSYVNVPLATL